MGEIKQIDEQQMGELIRMNRHLSQLQQPDVDAEWKAFLQKKQGDAPHNDNSSHLLANDDNVNSNRRPLWHLYVSVLVGAVAMLALVFSLRNYIGFGNQEMETRLQEKDVMAMVYDESPQRVALQSEGSKAIDITQRDSISFFQTPSHQLPNNATVYKMQHLSTPRGMDYKVILADGTEVWLNAESRIEFPSNFQGNERRVSLQGEAYLKVARNEQSPFIVSTEQMEVRVLGTEFNLKSYSNEAAHVTLVKGSVEVGDKRLTPGQDAWYDREGNIQVADVDVYDVVQWKDGFFYFNDKSLVTVLRELGRWYNLGVIFRNAHAMNHKVHFSALREGTIEEALSSLNSLRKVKISLQGNNIVVE